MIHMFFTSGCNSLTMTVHLYIITLSVLVVVCLVMIAALGHSANLLSHSLYHHCPPLSVILFTSIIKFYKAVMP